MVIQRRFSRKSWIILALVFGTFFSSCVTVTEPDVYHEPEAVVSENTSVEWGDDAAIDFVMPEEPEEKCIESEKELVEPLIPSESPVSATEPMPLDEYEEDLPAEFGGSGLLGTVPIDEGEADGITLYVSLWENGRQKELFEKAAALYEKSHPGVDIVAEYVDYASYWGNLAADAAGGRLGDILEMDRNHIAQFTERGLLRDFSHYVPQLAGYALPIGMTVDVMQYDSALLESIGIGFPDVFTLSSFIDTGRYVYEHTGIMTESSLSLDLMEAVVAFHGNDLYSEIMEGRTDSLIRYFSLVEAVRDNQFFTSRGSHCWNVFTDTTEVDPSRGIVSVSSSGMEPYALFSITSSSEYPETAADFILYLVSSEELADVLRLEFGVPAFRDIGGLELSEAEQFIMDFIMSLDGRFTLSVPPAGNAEISRVLSAVSASVIEGEMNAEEAAAQFVEEAAVILGKAKAAVQR